MTGVVLPTVPPSIAGAVKVLFVNVCVAANPTKLSDCKAVLNSANEPVTVLLAKSIVLFVSVSVVALPTSVSVALVMLLQHFQSMLSEQLILMMYSEHLNFHNKI